MRRRKHVTTPANTRGLESRLRRVEAATSAAETALLDERRRAFVDEMLATGRVAASEVASIERAFAASPEATVAIVSGRPANRAVAEANAAQETDEQRRAYAASFESRFGVSAEKTV